MWPELGSIPPASKHALTAQADQNGTKHQHEDRKGEIRRGVVAPEDMTNSDESMAPLRDDAYRDSDRKITLGVLRGAEVKRGHRQVKHSGDLDLADVDGWPGRSDIE